MAATPSEWTLRGVVCGPREADPATRSSGGMGYRAERWAAPGPRRQSPRRAELAHGAAPGYEPMNLVEGVPLIFGGTIVFAVGVLTMRPERDAPKDWRYWTGTVIGTLGAGVGLFGVLLTLEPPR